MRPIPRSPEVLGVARRVIWFEEPSQALADPLRFLAYVMTYGTAEDLAALQGVAAKEDFREALDHGPAGILDARSWAYWNLVTGRFPPPPRPKRQGLEPQAASGQSAQTASATVYPRQISGYPSGRLRESR